MMTKKHTACALVTGGKSGIGKAIAAALVAEGYRVAISGRDDTGLRKTAGDIRAELPLVCDIRKPEEVDRAFAQLVMKFGRLDVLVNNAGVGIFGNLVETDEEAWAAMIDTNLSGSWRVSKIAMPLLLKSRGALLNVISTAGRKGYPGSSAYCASKFGMLGLAESIREEVRAEGVRVINLMPGATATPFWDEIVGDWDQDRMVQPEDVAAAAISALKMPERTLVEEIVIRPAGGDL